LAVAALLALTGLAAYWNTDAVPFIYDDATYINAALRRPWPPWGTLPVRPVLGFTLWLNCMLGGLKEGGYHLVNLAIHVLAGCTLFGLARRTLQGEVLGPRFGAHAPALAFAIAVLWLVHPLQTQAVTYIIQRGESLMGLFYLLTLYCAIRAHGSPRRTWWWLGAGGCLLLGLGSKQVMVTAPLLIVLYYWVFVRTDGTDRTTTTRSAQSPAPSPQSPRLVVRGAWLVIAVVAALWLGLAAWLAVVSSHWTAGFGAEDTSPLAYAGTQCAVLPHYLRLALWPAGLCFDYGWKVAAHWGEVWPWVALTGTLGALTLIGLARRSALGFLGAWFFVILAPTSSFMPIRDVAVEHRMYLPLAGVLALLVAGAFLGGQSLLCRAAALWPGRHPPLMGPPVRPRSDCPPLPPAWLGPALGWGLLLAAVAALAWQTRARNAVYAHELTLWRDALRTNPQNPRAHSNVGAMLTRFGTPEQALAELEEAIALDPKYSDAYYNLGVALDRQGRGAEAARRYEQALAARPDYPEAHSNLANHLARRGQREEALRHYREALRIKPEYVDAYCNLGALYDGMGRLEEAAAAYRKALEINPYFAEAYSNLGNTLDKLGRRPEALEAYDRALRLKPELAEAHANRGNLLGKMGRFEEAVASLQTALKLKEDFADAHNNLGLALGRLGKLREAAAHFQRATELQPEQPVAHRNLAEACAALGRSQEALRHYQEAVRLKPDYVEAHYGLAVEALKTGQLRLGEAHLARAVELRPDFAAARSQLEQLRKALAQHPPPPKE
jgi:tetratricopeptide (TPR) repeat protein